MVGSKKLALHQIPSGIMYKRAISVIGNGCIVDPEVVIQEINTLESEGVSCENLRISGNAHLVMPYHKDLDGAHEQKLGKNLIGTTKRGVGPTYMDKMNRIGLRVQDLLDDNTFNQKLEAALAYINPILTDVYGLKPYDQKTLSAQYLNYAQTLKPYILSLIHI